ncbi:MAG: aminoglycoside phosphotransferase family protein [Clostridia bacterium]|nr:aminoglycoside phosphotransferase family protein [Clostridia bacterium]
MENIIRVFYTDGQVINCARYGNGHINETYLLSTNHSHLYILQKLNKNLFPDCECVMDNIIAVTSHLKKKSNIIKQTLTLVPTRNGDLYYVTETGDFWRLYEFVNNSICLDSPESPDDFRQSAIAYGQFQNALADFPAETLNETISRFHDTPSRFEQLKCAVSEDRAGRVKTSRREIDAFFAREQEGAILAGLLQKGELPLRVTHNDTKLNNVMLDDVNRKPLCVIDLDTVMPGLVAYDFGDSIRFGASTAAEDEQDLEKVRLSIELFQVYSAGFLSECYSNLTTVEIETLPLGAKTMTLECGVRFLTDYLNGDIYFRTAYPTQNLIRCRTQLKLVEEMDKNWQEMNHIIQIR